MKKTKYITYMAMLLALIVALSFFESTLPPFPFLPPGVKIGLANVVTMFALFFIGKKEAFTLNMAKSVFVGITRGVTAGILSFCGGVLSILILILLCSIFKSKISYLALSICGAVAHNMGQLLAVSLMMNNYYTVYYIPILLISGIIMGSITGVLLKTLLPVLSYPARKEFHK